MSVSIVVSVLFRTLVAGTPLLLATMGEILTERSGVQNLGVEGMMSVGAVTAFIVTFITGSPLVGLLAAVIVTGLFAGLHGFVSITLQANQVISGLALSMLGLGAAGLWGKPYVGQSLTRRFLPIEIPGLSRIPVIGPVLFSQNIFFYLAVILGIGLWILLYRTRWGVRIRSVGENPRASESQGVNVSRIRYLCVMIGGGFSGLAGANLSLAYNKTWIEGIVAGRGWIALALTIFALWNPGRAFVGAFLFGGIFVLQYLLQPLGISPNVLAMLPYLTTLLVLFGGAMIRGRRAMAPPAKLGEAYKRSERD